jgi:3-oxoadipate enol-lactonase
LPFCNHLYYEEHGSGRPLLLLHGNTLDHTTWSRLLRTIATHFHVILPDLPGHGQSGLSTTGSLVADDLAALVKHLGLEQVAVGGFSLGGAIALHFALNHPDACDSLILIDSTLYGYRFTDWAGPRRYIELANSVSIHAAMTEWLTDPIFAPALARPAGEELRRMVMAFPGLAWAPKPIPFFSLGTPDTERLHQVCIPTLVLVGEQDLPDFHRIADLLTQSIQGAHKVIVPQSGHFVPLEQPAALAEALQAHLARS